MRAEETLAAYREYYRHVELHWSLQRDRLIIVSPIEFEAIQMWYEAEVPLPVVLEAISEFVARKKKAKRTKNFLLTHVNDTVVKLFEAWKSLHEGEGAEEGELLPSKVKALVRKLRTAAKVHQEHKAFFDELIASIRAIDIDSIVRFEDVDKEIESLDACMINRFESYLEEEDAKAIREEVSDLLTEEEDPEFFRKMLRDSVRSHFGLPRLTLLG